MGQVPDETDGPQPQAAIRILQQPGQELHAEEFHGLSLVALVAEGKIPPRAQCFELQGLIGSSGAACQIAKQRSAGHEGQGCLRLIVASHVPQPLAYLGSPIVDLLRGASAGRELGENFAKIAGLRFRAVGGIELLGFEDTCTLLHNLEMDEVGRKHLVGAVQGKLFKSAPPILVASGQSLQAVVSLLSQFGPGEVVLGLFRLFRFTKSTLADQERPIRKLGGLVQIRGHVHSLSKHQKIPNPFSCVLLPLFCVEHAQPPAHEVPVFVRLGECEPPPGNAGGRGVVGAVKLRDHWALTPQCLQGLSLLFKAQLRIIIVNLLHPLHDQAETTVRSELVLQLHPHLSDFALAQLLQTGLLFADCCLDHVGVPPFVDQILEIDIGDHIVAGHLIAVHWRAPRIAPQPFHNCRSFIGPPITSNHGVHHNFTGDGAHVLTGNLALRNHG
mmetsp:Transcript_4631/g.10933  ORF Transcript_4631/g.10933 Transcript_4631/m.10933 type:complete len:444 (+) Transcript_4631:642-1973(+)